MSQSSGFSQSDGEKHSSDRLQSTGTNVSVETEFLFLFNIYTLFFFNPQEAFNRGLNVLFFFFGVNLFSFNTRRSLSLAYL